MFKSVTNTYWGLIALTLLVALLSFLHLPKAAAVIILLLSITKFWLVAFQFMELKKAHSFWKLLIIFYGIIMVGAISILLQ